MSPLIEDKRKYKADVRQDKTVHDNPTQRARQHKTITRQQDKARQDKTRQGKKNKQEEARQDSTRQDSTKQDR
jgi:hypothetical protein